MFCYWLLQCVSRLFIAWYCFKIVPASVGFSRVIMRLIWKKKTAASVNYHNLVWGQMKWVRRPIVYSLKFYSLIFSWICQCYICNVRHALLIDTKPRSVLYTWLQETFTASLTYSITMLWLITKNISQIKFNDYEKSILEINIE